MIRVAHISGARSWRGAEQQIGHLLLANSGSVENFVFCPQGSELQKRYAEKTDRVFSYSKYFGLDLAGAWRLKQFARKNGITLLHAHDSHALNLCWAARFMGLDLPVVATRHVNFRPGNPYKYRGEMIRRIICVSEAVRETMAGITDAQRLCVINPGIDSIPPGKNYLLHTELSLPEDAFLIGTAGALEKEKDPGAFLKIAGDVIRENKSVHAVIAGDGSLRGMLEQEIRNQSLQGRVHLLGFRNDVKLLLSELDLFLLTSRSEGFPLAPVEAMQAGIPVIARQYPGVDELIPDSRCGFIVSSEAGAVELVLELLPDIKRRSEIGRQARERALLFSVDRLIEKTHNLYHEILS